MREPDPDGDDELWPELVGDNVDVSVDVDVLDGERESRAVLLSIFELFEDGMPCSCVG